MANFMSMLDNTEGFFEIIHESECIIQGTFNSSNSTYRGSMIKVIVNGKERYYMHGIGEYCCSDGTLRVGNFHMSVNHGLTLEVNAAGVGYVGDWVNGVKQGNGILVTKIKRAHISGIWENDALIFEGVTTSKETFDLAYRVKLNFDGYQKLLGQKQMNIITSLVNESCCNMISTMRKTTHKSRVANYSLPDLEDTKLKPISSRVWGYDILYAHPFWRRDIFCYRRLLCGMKKNERRLVTNLYFWTGIALFDHLHSFFYCSGHVLLAGVCTLNGEHNIPVVLVQEDPEVERYIVHKIQYSIVDDGLIYHVKNEHFICDKLPRNFQHFDTMKMMRFAGVEFTDQLDLSCLYAANMNKENCRILYENNGAIGLLILIAMSVVLHFLITYALWFQYFHIAFTWIKYGRAIVSYFVSLISTVAAPILWIGLLYLEAAVALLIVHCIENCWKYSQFQVNEEDYNHLFDSSLSKTGGYTYLAVLKNDVLKQMLFETYQGHIPICPTIKQLVEWCSVGKVTCTFIQRNYSIVNNPTGNTEIDTQARRNDSLFVLSVIIDGNKDDYIFKEYESELYLYQERNVEECLNLTNTEIVLEESIEEVDCKVYNRIIVNMASTASNNITAAADEVNASMETEVNVGGDEEVHEDLSLTNDEIGHEDIDLFSSTHHDTESSPV